MMPSYVLHEVSAAQRQRLANAGVQFSDWADGVLVNDRAALVRSMAALGTTAIELPSQFPDLIDVVLQPQYEDETTAAPRETPAWARALGRTEPVKPPAPPNDVHARARQAYVELCRIRLEKLRESARNLAAPRHGELRKAALKFVELTRRATFAGMSDEELRSKIRQEMEQIRENPKVSEVRAVVGGIVVQTRDLLVTDPATNSEINLGKFTIWMRLETDNPEILWFNQMRRVDGKIKKGMNAPYVFADGHASVGDASQPMLDLIARLELSALADLAVQFIENIDEEQALNVDLKHWQSASWLTDNPRHTWQGHVF
jgi:hypothetical protein